MPPSPLNARTADQLLEGSIAAEDVPPGYLALVALLEEARDEAASLHPPNGHEIVEKMAAAIRRQEVRKASDDPLEHQE